MKKNLLLSIVSTIALLLSFSDTHSQKLINKNYYGEFIELPSHPLSIKKYSYIVYQNGESPDNNDKLISNYNMLKKVYDTDLKDFFVKMFKLDKQLYILGNSKELSSLKKQLEMGLLKQQRPSKPKRSDLNFEDQLESYRKENNVYNARVDSLNNAGLKFFIKSQMLSYLKETAPRKPYVKGVNDNEKYVLPDAIISSQLQIRGLERVYDNSSEIYFEISMFNFETEQEYKVDRGEKAMFFKFRRIVGYKIFDINKKIIEEGIIPSSDKWCVEKYKLSSINESYLKKEKYKFEKISAELSLGYTHTFLSSRYGYEIKRRNFILSYAKGRKFNYEKIKEAYDIAVNTLKSSLVKDNPDLSNLKESIAIWETELKESDYSNKKSRINTSISAGLYLNIIECSVWLNEFDKAINLLDEVSKLNLKSKYVRKIEKLRDFTEDRKNRYKAGNIEIVYN